MNTPDGHPTGTPPRASDLPGENWNHPLERRKFLVGTGKAGALTILALHGLKVEVCASGTPSGSPNI